ncbi:MAG: exodeoxyribonuclease VII small subunit [Legionellaceae bacterium]|jgi:exodeoxyribonuclease VII small subunit|nr:exodeoxyribonuclease VII small subunit [Legionellaceae bacterium]
MTKPAQFEKSIAELEQVVTSLEKGDLSLDNALKAFEQGIGLTRTCQTLLTNAEQHVEQLLNPTTPPDESSTDA